MFENMQCHEKSWSLLCDFMKIRYAFEFKKTQFIQKNLYYENYFNLNNDFILSIMPFFFDEHEIYIQIVGYLYEENRKSKEVKEVFYDWNIITWNDHQYEEGFKIRKEALINAVEKAFEILNNQLEENNENK